MININSHFPENIDELIFFHDIALADSKVMSDYQKLLAAGSYMKASKLLRESDLLYYGAGLFNLIENMLYCLQTYQKEHPKTNPHSFSYMEPSNAANGTIWTEGDPRERWLDYMDKTWNQAKIVQWNFL